MWPDPVKEEALVGAVRSTALWIASRETLLPPPAHPLSHRHSQPVWLWCVLFFCGPSPDLQLSPSSPDGFSLWLSELQKQHKWTKKNYRTTHLTKPAKVTQQPPVETYFPTQILPLARLRLPRSPRPHSPPLSQSSASSLWRLTGGRWSPHISRDTHEEDEEHLIPCLKGWRMSRNTVLTCCGNTASVALTFSGASIFQSHWQISHTAIPNYFLLCSVWPEWWAEMCPNGFIAADRFILTGRACDLRVSITHVGWRTISEVVLLFF